MTYCKNHRYNFLGLPACPLCVADERDRLKEIVRSLVESYDILVDHSPLAKNDIARGVIRGAFIGAIDDARAAIMGER